MAVSTFQLLYNTYYKPWKVSKLESKSPIAEFRNKGFLPDKEGGFIGRVRGYSVLVGLYWTGHQPQPKYFSQILFNPTISGRFLRQDEYQKFHEELRPKYKEITLNSVVKEYDRYRWYKKIQFDTIFGDIIKTIDFLRSRKLEPIEVNQWEAMIPELELHAESFPR